MLTGFRAYLLAGLMLGTPTRGWHARQRHEPPGDRGGGEERAVRAAVTGIGARYRSKGVRACGADDFADDPPTPDVRWRDSGSSDAPGQVANERHNSSTTMLLP